ncbi:regulatory protein RecX [Subtercola endophyticus]|uniref:regulatory protein RecX n=1 Tax=Subtercola endophyticus TaxID=2895559 RepID=UPI001E338444|nr:RecX family transcriptional regulator [Subtercola endophyticus]UFS60727.1 RecX family transcriptional regulator [Subtercola endophyticus]
MTAKVTYLPGVVPVDDESRALQSGVAATSWHGEPEDAEYGRDDQRTEPAMSEGEREAFLENVVVRALARKSLSEWEVTNLLAANGVDESEFEQFLDRYRANRYVDDYDLAETLVESLQRRKGYGRSQIRHELSARHVAPEIISVALAVLSEDDELRKATELAEKRAPTLARLDAATAERRLTSFLMRKGYPSSVVRAAVAAALKPQPRAVRFR